MTWNHAYLHGKVRLAHFWAGDNDRGAKLARTNPMLALFEFGDQGELLPRWTFAGYLPRDCQVGLLECHCSAAGQCIQTNVV